mgnify:FL=1
MREADIQNLILMALSDAGCKVWRQNVGVGWTGDATRLNDGSVLIRNPRPLHAGLCRGSSDIIGITTEGRFLAVEVKTQHGRVTPEQENFIARIGQQGGVSGVCRSVEDALNLIK